MNALVALTILETVSTVVVTVRSSLTTDNAPIVMSYAVGFTSPDGAMASPSKFVTPGSVNVPT